MATINIAMKVNRAITGATTVNANCYAMVTYNPTTPSHGSGVNTSTLVVAPPITRHFGPGQSIPASFTTTLISQLNSGTFSTGTMTWQLQSGVELINTQ